MFRRFRSHDETTRSSHPRFADTTQRGSSRFSKIPVEILYYIFSLLIDEDRPYDEIQHDFLALTATSRFLRAVLPVELVYNCVSFANKRRALKFLKAISHSKHGSELKLQQQSICHISFVNPSQEFLVNNDVLGYSSNLSNQIEPEKIWAEIILDILSRLPNVQSIDLQKVSPKFEFPLRLATTKVGQTIIKSKLPKLHSIYLSSERGWNVTLRQSLLWPFGSYRGLHLHNVIVDLSIGGKSGLLAREITLSSCLVVPQKLEYQHHSLFRRVNTLNLDHQTLWQNSMPSVLFPSLQVLNLGWTAAEAGTCNGNSNAFESRLYSSHVSRFFRNPFVPVSDLNMVRIVDASLRLDPTTINVCASSHKDISSWLTSTERIKEHPSLQCLTLLIPDSVDINLWSKFDFNSIPIPLQIVSMDSQQVLFTNMSTNN